MKKQNCYILPLSLSASLLQSVENKVFVVYRGGQIIDSESASSAEENNPVDSYMAELNPVLGLIYKWNWCIVDLFYTLAMLYIYVNPKNTAIPGQTGIIFCYEWILPSLLREKWRRFLLKLKEIIK